MEITQGGNLETNPDEVLPPLKRQREKLRDCSFSQAVKLLFARRDLPVLFQSRSFARRLSPSTGLWGPPPSPGKQPG